MAWLTVSQSDKYEIWPQLPTRKMQYMFNIEHSASDNIWEENEQESPKVPTGEWECYDEFWPAVRYYGIPINPRSLMPALRKRTFMDDPIQI